jgi:SAM-dependent methyltransferase
MEAKYLDVRPEEDYEKSHLMFSASIPWDQLPNRMHELPPRGASLNVVLPQGMNQDDIKSFFEARGYLINSFREDIPQQNLESNEIEVGKRSFRLWKCCSFLEEAIPIIEQSIQPSERDAMDLACGSARDAIYLAMRGWKITAIDYLDSLLEKAMNMAQKYELENFDTKCIDMESDPNSLDNLPQVNLIHVARYLHRPLFVQIRRLVKIGGFVVYHTFTKGVEKFGKPRRQRFILEPEELIRLLPGFNVIRYREDVIEDGRPIQFIIAQKFDNL